MPANGTYLICLTAATLVLLLFLILVVKLHAFIALLISAMAMGLASGMPPDKVLKSIQAGFGDALGFIAVVLGLGAMIGRFLEYSGGGRALADWLLKKFGIEHAAWAMLAAAFLVGLPIFFEVGFIILVPLVWNLARETKRSLLFYGLPMAAALTTTHSPVPPPSDRHLLRGRVHHPRASGVEPGPRNQAVALVLWLAHGGRADDDAFAGAAPSRSEEHTSELQSLRHLVC